jgi:hypothetical protein
MAGDYSGPCGRRQKPRAFTLGYFYIQSLLCGKGKKMIFAIGIVALITIVWVNQASPNDHTFTELPDGTMRREVTKVSKAAPIKWFAVGVLCLVILLEATSKN